MTHRIKENLLKTAKKSVYHVKNFYNAMSPSTKNFGKIKYPPPFLFCCPLNSTKENCNEMFNVFANS